MILLFFVPITVSFLRVENENHVVGNWGLNVVAINSDTIFHRDNLSYSIQYNLKKASDFTFSSVDYDKIVEDTEVNFEKMKNIKLSFQLNKQIYMTKTRSGGRIDLESLDSGFYEIKQDSLFITLSSRNNYQMLLLFNKFANRIFILDGFPDHKVFTEYIKLKDEQ